MRFVQMEAATFLVREKGLDPEAFGIQATRLLSCVHIADHIQRLFLPFGPTTEEEDWPICVTCHGRLRELDERPWLATRPYGLQAKGCAIPQGRHVTPRAAHRPPPCLVQRGLEVGPIALPIAQYPHPC